MSDATLSAPGRAAPRPVETARDRPAAAVVLAAGRGVRMASDLPKTLHPVGGRAMLAHVIATARAVCDGPRIVVVGHQADRVSAAAAGFDAEATAVLQEPQRGTAHAVAQARAALDGWTGDVFVLYGDTPLIRAETLRRLSQARASGAAAAVLGFEARVPGGYGRLMRDPDGALARIVEAKDATPDELATRLCNSGVMCVDGARLFGWLDRIDDDNAKGEFYLTDLVALARADGAAAAVVVCDEAEVLGVNSRAELAAAEAAFQTRARVDAMAAGATLTAPETVYFSYDTELGRDVEVEPHVVFGPGVRVEGAARIRAFSHLEGCRVAAGAVVGPYARLRPGADLGPGARIGNFVEVKNAKIGSDAKINHLSYVGDARIGEGANLGAGVITCNYDGVAKHRTEIGSDAFIGSNAALVAPVRVGDGALVAAGSVITRDVASDALALARGKQIDKPGFAAKLRAKLADAARRKNAER